MQNGTPNYIGRFAPSPTGPLHAGSLVAALASWLDARTHAGLWLVRMEDLDNPRCKPAFSAQILHQLSACHLSPDQPPVYQSSRTRFYQTALDILRAQAQAYPCSCSRKSIVAAQQKQAKTPTQELVYPGWCTRGLQNPQARQVAWRLRTYADLHQMVGDFVLKRADGYFSYQLAVVLDDALQGVTHVVRGADLKDNSPRQIYLQQCLGLPHPEYLHTPLVLTSSGEKLSKQTQAKALVPENALADLQLAAQILGLPMTTQNIPESLLFWEKLWPSCRNAFKTSFF